MNNPSAAPVLCRELHFRSYQHAWHLTR